MAMDQVQFVFGEVLKRFLRAYQMTRVLCKSLFFTLSGMGHLPMSLWIKIHLFKLKYFHRFRVFQSYNI